MAPALATTRLRKELIKLQTEPPPGVIAEPKESNILTWYYAIRGPVDTPYQGGIYVGKLLFPSEYPMKAPSITMATPSGRFQCNTKICMSMTDFHPESWNPMWSVGTIIQGIQSFMASDELTTGGITATDEERTKLAKISILYNRQNFPHLFDGDIETAMNKAEEISHKAQKEQAKEAVVAAASSSRGGGRSVARRNRKVAARNNLADEEDEGNEEDEGECKEIEVEASQAHESSETTLTEEEMEKRRKRNAKKRAKQKAKKATAASTGATREESESTPKKEG